jgi:hypothetical protein
MPRRPRAHRYGSGGTGAQSGSSGATPSPTLRTSAGRCRRGNLAAIRAALEAAGVIFIDENGEGPGVRLRKTNVYGQR